MIAAFMISVALLATPETPTVAEACHPARASFTPVLEEGKLVLPPAELARIEAFAGAIGAGAIGVTAEWQGPRSNDAVIVVSDALAKAGVDRVQVMISSGPRQGYARLDPPPPLVVWVTVACGA